MTDAIAPGGTVGILGGGQLGRMLAIAAAQLGLKAHIYAPEDNPPAGDVAAAVTQGGWDDEAALSAPRVALAWGRLEALQRLLNRRYEAAEPERSAREHCRSGSSCEGRGGRPGAPGRNESGTNGMRGPLVAHTLSTQFGLGAPQGALVRGWGD